MILLDLSHINTATVSMMNQHQAAPKRPPAIIYSEEVLR